MRRSPMAAIATLALVLGTAGVAAAVAPSPDGDKPLVPSNKSWTETVIGSDAVFSLSGHRHRFESQLFTRSLNADETTLELGASTFIGRASGYSMAEHEGYLAYTAWDGRLALRAPDGTQTRPEWGANEAFNLNGPTSMSDRWLVAGSMVFDRESGADYDLSESLAAALEFDHVGTWVVRVVDDRAVGEVWAWNDGPFEQFQGIFTVELGYAGPVGTPVLLDGGTGNLKLAGLTDQAIAWLTVTSEWDSETWESTVTTALRWVPREDPNAPYAEVIFGAGQWPYSAWTYGTSVAVSFGSSGPFFEDETTLRAIDLANLAGGEQTLAVPRFFAVLDVAGPLVAWTADGGRSTLTDLLDREVIGAGRSPGVAPRGTAQG